MISNILETDDILCEIFKYLTDDSLCNISMVCKKLKYKVNHYYYYQFECLNISMNTSKYIRHFIKLVKCMKNERKFQCGLCA